MTEDIGEIVGNCWHDGKRHYQRFMDDQERKVNKNHNAFCLVEDSFCKYYVNNKNKCYCTADEVKK